MAVTQAPKSGNFRLQQVPYNLTSLDGENLFTAILDYSEASSELANQDSLFSTYIDRATISRISIEAARRQGQT